MPQFRKRPTKRAQELRNHPTDAEQALWHYLSRRGLNGHKFSRQVSVGPFICDFMCRERRLAVEVDGGQHAESPAQDRSRPAYLERLDVRVIRFWNDEVLTNIEGVLETILAEIERREPRFIRSHPQPPPASGRGLT
jgi:very-short-patch-repair endonuclease